MKTANKAVILDLGGVVLYPPRGDWNIPSNARAVLGGKTEDFYSPAFTRTDVRLTHIMDSVILGGTEEDEFAANVRYFMALSREMGWNLPSRDAQSLAYTVTYTTDRHAFYSEAPAYLARWNRNYVLAALSDTLPSIYRYMKHSALSPHFDYATYSVEVGHIKPHPAMYRTILGKIGLPPSACLFVDDKVENLIAAENMGMKAVRMSRDHYTITPVEPNAGEWHGRTARNFAELDRILKGGIWNG